MSVTAEQVSGYEGKKVLVIRNLPQANDKGEQSVEIEGQVQVGNELGLLIKPKGQVQFKLIPLSEIEEISLKQDTNTKLKRSKIAPVKVGQARRHLLERHGVTLEWANGVTEEQAREYHESIDHEAADLGHIHVNKEDKSSSNGDADSSSSSAGSDEE